MDDASDIDPAGIRPPEGTNGGKRPRVDPLARRAVRSGWAVPPEIAAKLVAGQAAIAAREDLDPDVRIRAFRSVLAADQHACRLDTPPAGANNVQVNVIAQGQQLPQGMQPDPLTIEAENDALAAALAERTETGGPA